MTDDMNDKTYFLVQAVEDRYMDTYVIGVFSTLEKAKEAQEANKIIAPEDWVVPIQEILLDIVL